MKTKADRMTHYRFLNRIRESGRINMFGAAEPLQKAYGIPRQDARKILTDWMAWVSEKPSNRDL